MTVKKIIVGGCSFSTAEYNITAEVERDTWPYRVQERYPDIPIRFTANCGIGQELIQKKLSRAIIEELKTYKPEELLVIVMWSGTDRKAFYVDNKDYIEDMVKYMANIKHLPGLTQFDELVLGSDKHKKTAVTTDSKFDYYVDGGWYIANYMHPDSKLMESYMKTMVTRLAQVTISLENIIFLQNLCKIHNINLVQSFYRSHVYDDIMDYKDHLNIKYLLNQLDYTTIVSTTGLFDYLSPQHKQTSFNKLGDIFFYLQNLYVKDEQKKYFGSDNFHPSELGTQKWTTEVLFPKLAEFGL